MTDRSQVDKSIGTAELEMRRAVASERQGWQDAIFRAAKDADINTERLSAGQILTVMSATIIELKQKVNSG